METQRIWRKTPGQRLKGIRGGSIRDGISSSLEIRRYFVSLPFENLLFCISYVPGHAFDFSCSYVLFSYFVLIVSYLRLLFIQIQIFLRMFFIQIQICLRMFFILMKYFVLLFLPLLLVWSVLFVTSTSFSLCS